MEPQTGAILGQNISHKKRSAKFLIEVVKEKPKNSVKKITKEMATSRCTISRIRKESLNYKYFVPNRCHSLTVPLVGLTYGLTPSPDCSLLDCFVWDVLAKKGNSMPSNTKKAFKVAITDAMDRDAVAKACPSFIEIYLLCKNSVLLLIIFFFRIYLRHTLIYPYLFFLLNSNNCIFCSAKLRKSVCKPKNLSADVFT